MISSVGEPVDHAAVLEQRRVAHANAGARLASLRDGALRSLLGRTSPTWRPWGGSHRVVVDGHPVFVKRLLLTDREIETDGSTRNVFDLPLFYSYGVGSAGFGAYRELAAHRSATELVLSGATTGFPLLHHHRVMVRDGPAPRFPMELDGYVSRWNGDPSVRAFIEAREASRYELWLFAEALPHVVHDWFPTHQHMAADVVEELRGAASSLNDRGIVHFDAHFGNALTDERRFYLSDFGLAMSEDFELDDTERSFLRAHTHYDRALVVWCLCVPLLEMHRALSPDARARADQIVGVAEDATRRGLTSALVRHAAALADATVVDLHPAYVEELDRYREVIVAMDDFLDEIGRPDKSARFDDRGIDALLDAADRRSRC